MRIFFVIQKFTDTWVWTMTVAWLGTTDIFTSIALSKVLNLIICQAITYNSINYDDLDPRHCLSAFNSCQHTRQAKQTKALLSWERKGSGYSGKSNKGREGGGTSKGTHTILQKNIFFLHQSSINHHNQQKSLLQGAVKRTCWVANITEWTNYNIINYGRLENREEMNQCH